MTERTQAILLCTPDSLVELVQEVYSGTKVTEAAGTPGGRGELLEQFHGLTG